MRGALVFLYGIICYLVFFLTFLYAIAFVADVGVPHTVDRGYATGTVAMAVVIDAVLLGIFAIQHSGMARRGFKRWLTSWLPESAERSTFVLLSSAALILLYWQWRPLPGVIWNAQANWAVYLLYALSAFGWLLVLSGTFVLLSSAALILLYWQWRPLPGVIWNAQADWAVYLLYALSAFGWLLVLSGTFVINHFDLFGLRQVWLAARGRPCTPLEFKQHFYYRVVRHPLMLGFVIAFWATPRMTTSHLLFAIATTGYILIAVKFFEERDLVVAHGEDYRRYQHEVPMICPWPRPRRASAKPAAPVQPQG